ncbi:hypothetical protein PR048_021700 [Dryococelus australis]|uniref:Uncharacterized protein n=1 Tax=Dryococelus australis TaxID=614101 RepID=A0ABQ9GYX9_9NEOP|nr:hypothetical protein PR048_021700 [Dryococelus australis]
MTSQTTEQHVDLRDSHRTMERRDSRILQYWLEIHSSIQHEHNVHSLSSGISAESRVSCDNAQAIGETVLQAIVGKTFAEATISRNARINSLSVMHNTVTINDKVVPVSENQLFTRIVCIMKSDTKKYELSTQPPALFDGPHMRKAEKSAFATLFKNVLPEENTTVGSPTFVIDGGYIIHTATTTWPRLANYNQICGMYVKHITNNYPSAVVVFDGYKKIQEQARRARRRPCPDIVFGEQTIVTTSQEDFLSNKNKKGTGIMEIWKCCIQVAIQKDIGDMQSAVLFAHAVTGCDKTSAIYGKGKIEACKLLQKSVSLRSELVNIFSNPASHPEKVANTGERFVQARYPGGDKFDNIDDL